MSGSICIKEDARRVKSETLESEIVFQLAIPKPFTSEPHPRTLSLIKTVESRHPRAWPTRTHFYHERHFVQASHYIQLEVTKPHVRADNLATLIQ